MKVLVTGGTGFVGMNVAEKLLTEGHEVIICSRNRPVKEIRDIASIYSGKINFIKLDITNQEEIEKVFDDYSIDCVVNSAVITPGVNREKKESKLVLDVNLMGVIYILEEIKRRRHIKFIQISSDAVYGDARLNNESVYEDEELTHLDPKNLYGISKFSAEKIVLRYIKLFCINAIILRLGTVFGPWERDTGVRDTLSPPFLATRTAVQGKHIIMHRLGKRDWIYSRDVAVAVYKIILKENCSYRIYNLGANSTWTMVDWCERLTTHFSSFSFEVDKKYKGNNYLPLYSNYEKCHMNINRLINDVGFTPSNDFNDYFDEYIEWMKKQYKE